MKPLVILSMFITMAALCSMGCTSLARQTEGKMGQHAESFVKEITTTVRSDYLLYLPQQYQTSKKQWPLILFLHGAGERGEDVSKVADVGPPRLIRMGKNDFPFVIVSPQCPENDWWTNDLQIDTLNALLDDVVSRYRIDEDRIYVTGLSMGGFGTWRLAAAYPHRFAAIAPICGGGNPEDAASIAHLPAWVFHGAKDPVVPIAKAEEMVEALKKAGGDVKFTIYPEAEHDSWTETYDNPDLYKWFLSHSLSHEK